MGATGVRWGLTYGGQGLQLSFHTLLGAATVSPQGPHPEQLPAAAGTDSLRFHFIN